MRRAKRIQCIIHSYIFRQSMFEFILYLLLFKSWWAQHVEPSIFTGLHFSEHISSNRDNRVECKKKPITCRNNLILNLNAGIAYIFVIIIIKLTQSMVASWSGGIVSCVDGARAPHRCGNPFCQWFRWKWSFTVCASVQLYDFIETICL